MEQKMLCGGVSVHVGSVGVERQSAAGERLKTKGMKCLYAEGPELQMAVSESPWAFELRTAPLSWHLMRSERSA